MKARSSTLRKLYDSKTIFFSPENKTINVLEIMGKKAKEKFKVETTSGSTTTWSVFHIRKNE